MFSRFFSRIAGRRCGSCGSTSLPRRRRPAQRIAAAAGQAMDALESRVLLSTLYVDASAPGPTYNGSSWTTAYKDLQLALSASTAGDEIRIADGTYKPTSTTDLTISFALRDGVGIYGGYAGYGASSPDARDIALNATILSGDIGAAGSKNDNSYHVLTATGVGSSTILDGVTMTGGYARGSDLSQYSGGGLFVADASPTLVNCTFSGNTASNGGGMYATSSSAPTLTNCTFSGNSASSGGGMYNTSSSPTLTNCTFSANSASGFGGGMHNASSSPALTNCSFSGNSASSSGGGMQNVSSSPRLTNCILWGNSAGNHGGGMYNSSSSSPVVTNCTISGNSASTGGGIGGFPSPLINCIVWGNSAQSFPQFFPPIDSTTVTYSDIQGGCVGVGNIDADPLFVRTPWTGPDGVFGTVDDDNAGDLRLRAGSPALDIGSNAAIPAGVSTDLAGNARIQNGTVDLGSYEGYVFPKVLYVDRAAGGANTGVSWADAFTSLQSALAAAWDGDTIRIADGTYKPTSTTDRTLSFALRNGVSIYGGYAGHGASDPDARDIALYPTILSGDIGLAGNKTDNSYHVLTANAVGSSTLLDGVTVTGGYASGSGSNQTYGGGLLATGASPTLVNCTFSVNSASSGGGMYNSSSSPTLINCTFSGNSATSSGGGVYNASSSPTLSNCVFSGNSVTGSNSSGAGMYNSSASPTLSNCIFSGNATTGTNSYGGGMYNASSSSPTLNNCTFSKNAASRYGGGVYSASSSPILTNCTFGGNSATTSGGGMFNSSASPTLVNCTFSGNSAGTGGGMYNIASSSPTLTNCIVWGNSNGAIHNSSSSPVVTCSDIQGGYAGAGNIDADPLFARSPWTGTDGLFGTADDDPGDFRLRAGSPALDIGSNAAVPAGVSADLAGNDRIQNGTVDLGAYEGLAAPPRVLYVDRAAGGANTGVSWAHAFTSLQSALASAFDGDTIRVADGTYKPTSTTDRTVSFALRNAVSIYGGYAGYGATDPDERDIVAYPTMLSGNIGQAASTADNSYHVLTANGAGASTVLDGVTVTAGNANGTGTNQGYGGGLYATGSYATIANCTFSSNSANTYGGGMYNSTCMPTLTNCLLWGNSAGNAGGGMYNSYSSATLTNCTLWQNSASFGGGMCNSYSSPRLANCIVWGNTRDGIYNASLSTPTVSYSDIQRGHAGTGNIDADPLFVRFPWTGPDGVFGTDDDDPGDLHLRPGSPALDIGSDAAVAGLSTDRAGNARIQDDRVDLGAYEGPIAPALKILFVDGTASGANTGVSWADAFTSLQSALAAASDGDTIRIADGIYKPTSTTDRAIGFALRNGVAIHGGYAGYGVPDPDARDIVAYPTILSGNIGAAGKGDNSYHVLTASRVSESTILDGVTVTEGYAIGSGANQSFGGGMYSTSASPTLVNCTFSGNLAFAHGGGIYNSSSSPTLTSCTIRGNSTTATYGDNGDGGGMYNTTTSSPTLVNCAFSSNSATRNGGGVSNSSSSSPKFTNCVFSANSASGNGGGMYNSSASPKLTNCTFSGNWAKSDGGAMHNVSSSLAMTNCIVWDNIQSGVAGVGSTSANPLFVRTPWTGPDGVFGTADDDAGDLRLRAGSPALDIGSNAAVAGISTDLAGNVRTQNGTVDLGAYEGPTAAPAPTILYVDGAASGANSGISWADAFTSLQSALAASCNGDIIRVADGTYKPTSTADRTISFALRNEVGIYGGYAGHGAADPGTRDIALYPTILSGDVGTVGSDADNSYHVVTATSVGPSMVLDGVTVTGGNANGTVLYQTYGGGFLAISSSPAVANCTFSGNSAGQGGGGMCNTFSSSPTLINCTFSRNLAGTGNHSNNYGGGMYNRYESSPMLIGCTFSGNAVTSNGNYGGGMNNTVSSSPTLINCTFIGNSASRGGGMDNTSSSSPTLINCILWGNLASSSPQLYQSGGTPVVTHSDIQGGYAGIGNINADPLFVRSPWTGPDGVVGTADDDPGDLRLRPGSPVINVGSNAAVPADVGTDLAGNARIQDGSVDMGAYEGMVAPPARKILYVDGAATGANTGVSWADAFTSLQSALAAAGGGDTIRIADGTYRPTSATNRALGFALRDAVAIYGGYAGHGEANPDARNIALYPTILSGDIGTIPSNADNSYHVVTASGVGASTLLDGVTITAGNANGTGANQLAGGGLFATGGVGPVRWFTRSFCAA